MACDSSLFGSTRALLVTASAPRLSKHKASSAQALAGFCSRPSVPGDRCWYNPRRMRKKWFRPSEPIRHWVEAESSASLLDSTGVGIMVVSYNILGDHNAWNHRDLYCKASFDLLKWESRKSLICNEICKWNADLVCLQEVDRYYDILSVMKREGYVGKYKRRTGGTRDGCVVLWKEKRFRLIEAENIEFSDFGLRDNVAQLFVFEMCEADSRRIVIGNIHVLFNPKRGDVKLGQVRILFEKAYGLSEKWGNVPILLMGDFNCTPESGIYKFLSTSKLNIAEHDRSGLSGQEKNQSAPFDLLKVPNFGWTDKELRNATGSSICMVLKHPLKLRSSYATVKGTYPRTRGSHGEPLATTYHSKFRGTVDYIWYSSGLAPTKVLDTLPIDTLLRIGGLPCKDLGSDHLPLVAEFVLQPLQQYQNGAVGDTTKEYRHHTNMKNL